MGVLFRVRKQHTEDMADTDYVLEPYSSSLALRLGKHCQSISAHFLHADHRLHLTIFPNITITAAAAAAKSLQSCPTLCDPIDGSPPGSPVPGILQARTLEGLPFPSPMHESEK